MTTFDKREQAFENKFAYDELARFKTLAIRDRQLGMWIGAKIGKSGDDLTAYAQQVVRYNHQRPGDDDLIEAILKDTEAAGLLFTSVEIRQKLIEIEKEIISKAD